MKITTVLSLLLLDVSFAVYNVKDDIRMKLDPAPFQWGVASGDPTTTSVKLWTRVKSDHKVKVTISADKSMAPAMDVKTMETNDADAPTESNDYSVHFTVNGLSPGTVYWYQFEVNGQKSRLGRTKTAPDNTDTEIRVGVVSCSSHWDGWHNAYRALLSQNIDFVIHMGDLDYDSLPPADFERRRVPSPVPAFVNPKVLQSWRQLHEYMRTDTDYRNLLAYVPWVVQWDNHDVDHEGGEQAFLEWWPISQPDSKHCKEHRIDRTINYGPMLDIFVIDTHLGHKDGGGDMLGRRQLGNLTKAIPASTARYRLLSSTKTMAPWKVMRLPFKLFHEKAAIGDLKQAFHPRNWFRFGRPPSEQTGDKYHLYRSNDVYFDTGLWDGSPKERAQLLSVLKAKGNNIVVSGDTHTSLASDVLNAGEVHDYKPCNGEASAVEFAPPSVSRGNWDEGIIKALKMDPKSNVLWKVNYIRAAMAKVNPHHAFMDMTQHGYGVLTIAAKGKGGVSAEYFFVDKSKPMDKVRGEKIATLVMRDGGKCWDRELSQIPMYHTTLSGVLGGHIVHTAKRVGKWFVEKGRKVKEGAKRVGKWFKKKWKNVFGAETDMDDLYYTDDYYYGYDYGGGDDSDTYYSDLYQYYMPQWWTQRQKENEEIVVRKKEKRKL